MRGHVIQIGSSYMSVPRILHFSEKWIQAAIERKLDTVQRGGFVKRKCYPMRALGFNVIASRRISEMKYIRSAVYATLEMLSMQVGWQGIVEQGSSSVNSAIGLHCTEAETHRGR